MSEEKMRLTCLNCSHEFEGEAELDELGWHSACPECKSSFDVDVPERRFAIAFAKEGAPDDPYKYFTDDFTGEGIGSLHTFAAPEEFIAGWRKLADAPPGAWYWCLDTYPDYNEAGYGVYCVCSGACDPGDIELFAEYPPLSEAAKLQMSGQTAESVEKDINITMGGLVE